ncbi:hypothetical protein FACS189473_0250 [Spirochaetia bacterium]|nr:hypothetical protein FACS189473_0250 [Spirochaetia bacterium]
MNAAQEGREKLNRAIRAGVQRDYGKAVRILEDLISAFDAPPEAYLFLGRSLHALKDYSRALAAFTEFVRLRPRSPEGYRFAGRAYLTLGMPQQAALLLEKALKLADGARHHPEDACRPSDGYTMALLGTAYLKAKRSKQAADMLQRAVEAAAGLPSSPGAPAGKPLSPAEQRRIYRAYLNALLIRGIRLCRQEQYALGMPMLRFVLDNGDEEARNIPLLRLELGRACRETGLLDEAVEHYTQALNYAPDDTRIRWYRASILMSLGRSTEALQDLDRIRSSAGEAQELPEDLPWNSDLVDRFMIRSFLENGEWRRAADAAKMLLKRGEGGNQPAGLAEQSASAAQPSVRAAIHAMYAEAQRNLREYRSALNHLHRAIELDGHQIQLWYAMLLTAWEGEDWKSLKKALKSVKAMGGESEIIQRFSILLEVKTGIPDGPTTEAEDRRIIALLQNAVRTLGPEPDLMYALAERYLKTGLLDAAITWFTKIILIRQDYERAYLGEIAAWEGLLKDGDGKAAKKLPAAYDRYLEIWPDNRSIRRDRALFLIRRGEFTKAAAELEALLPWEPANPTLRRVLAYAYRKTGRYREAAFFLKSLLKEKPEDTGLLLEYTGCLTRAGAAQYAMAVLEKAMALFSHSIEVSLTLGALFYREKKIERAFDIFREAAAKHTKDARPYQWMAKIARQLGETEGAARYDREAKNRLGNIIFLGG